MKSEYYDLIIRFCIIITISLLLTGFFVDTFDTKWKQDIIKSSIQTDKPQFLMFSFEGENKYFKIEEINMNNFNNYVNVSNITIISKGE